MVAGPHSRIAGRVEHAVKQGAIPRRRRRGRLPEDLLDDAVLKRLPVLFRTLRGTRLTEKHLDSLIQRLRRE